MGVHTPFYKLHWVKCPSFSQAVCGFKTYSGVNVYARKSIIAFSKLMCVKSPLCIDWDTVI